MFFGAVFMLFQETTNVYQQPSYFLPIFLVLWLVGIVLTLGMTVMGFRKMKMAGKAACWFGLAGVFLMLNFLQWLLFSFAIARQNMSLTWGMASFMHLPVVLAAVCGLIGLTKLKAESE
jgi:hypothetical protein